MTDIESLNLKHYIDCEREYTSDEMVFILACATVVGDYEKMTIGEVIEIYRELLPIYSNLKEWLESEKAVMND